MVTRCSGKPLCAPPCLSEVAFEMVPVLVWLKMDLSQPFKDECQALPLFCATFFQAIDGLMFLALCLLVVSQAPQHWIFWDANYLLLLLRPSVCLLSHCTAAVCMCDRTHKCRKTGVHLPNLSLVEPHGSSRRKHTHLQTNWEEFNLFPALKILWDPLAKWFFICQSGGRMNGDLLQFQLLRHSHLEQNERFLVA